MSELKSMCVTKHLWPSYTPMIFHLWLKEQAACADEVEYFVYVVLLWTMNTLIQFNIPVSAIHRALCARCSVISSVQIVLL